MKSVSSKFVIAGLVPAIHVGCRPCLSVLRKAQELRSSPAEKWITGTSPVMTGKGRS